MKFNGGKKVRGKRKQKSINMNKLLQVFSTYGRVERKIFVHEMQEELYMGVKKMIRDKRIHVT